MRPPKMMAIKMARRIKRRRRRRGAAAAGVASQWTRALYAPFSWLHSLSACLYSHDTPDARVRYAPHACCCFPLPCWRVARYRAAFARHIASDFEQPRMATEWCMLASQTFGSTRKLRRSDELLGQKSETNKAKELRNIPCNSNHTHCSRKTLSPTVIRLRHRDHPGWRRFSANSHTSPV